MTKDQLEAIIGRIERDVGRIDEALSCARILLKSSPPPMPDPQETRQKPAKGQ